MAVVPLMARVPVRVRFSRLLSSVQFTSERTVSLQIQLGDGVVEDETPTQRQAKKPLFKKWWPWAIGGVVVGGAALGLILGLVPRSHQNINWVP